MYQIDQREAHHIDQTDKIDQTDQIYRLDPNLPIRNVVQDPSRTHPTQETCPRSCRLHSITPGNMNYIVQIYRSYISYRSYRSHRWCALGVRVFKRGKILISVTTTAYW